MKDNNISTKGLDRSSASRHNKNWIIEKFHDEKSRIIPLHNLNVLCESMTTPSPVYLTHKHFTQPSKLVDASIFLGIDNDRHYFAVDISSTELADHLCQQTDAVFQNLRSVVSLLDYRKSELLTLARFQIFWHSRNQYCGKCGHQTKSADAGHVRICQNESCHEYYFPSMDPAVIVLVKSGERCLLGRKKEWQKGMYSTLAGFVEPGETIEEAVIREIYEEAGVNVKNVEYQHSQSWLYPSSLMLGFTATAKDEEIIIDNNELEDARWFTREEIKSNPRVLPYKISIAHKLITEWLGEGS